MYKLKIKDSNNNWVNADIGEDKPAITYQANDIAELQDRQGTFSQALKLPKTAINQAIFENLDVFENNTLAPYKTYECRLYYNDYELAGIGAMLYVIRVSTAYEVQILAGNTDIFETMSNTLIEDVDLGNFIIGTIPPSWVRMAYCGIGKFDNTTFTDLYYFLNLYQIITKMINHLGYTLQTNLLSAPKANDYISLADMKPQADSLDMFDADAIIIRDNVNITMGATQTFYVLSHNIINNGLNNLIQIGSGNIPPNAYQLKYTSNIDGRIKIAAFAYGLIYNDTNNHINFRYQVLKNGVQEFIYETLYVNHLIDLDEDIFIDVAVGDEIFITVLLEKNYLPSYTFSLDLDLNTHFYEIEAKQVPLYGKLYLNNNTGFDNIFDIFKAYMQTYALTCYVDNANKVIYANTFDKLYVNKATAKDWSNKLVLTNENILSFMLDNYAQNNNILFKEKDDYQEKGTFAIANTAIRDNTKDLFTIAWESGQDVIINNQELAYIPVYKYSSLTEKEYDGTNPHLVSVTPVGSTNWFANHIKAQTLVDTYYTKLKDNMLVNAKTLEVYLLLDEKDIEEFDPFTPVYISYFGAYFYVNKINNFVAKQITKVELIKL